LKKILTGAVSVQRLQAELIGGLRSNELHCWLPEPLAGWQRTEAR